MRNLIKSQKSDMSGPAKTCPGGPIRAHMDPYGPMRAHKGPYGPIRAHMGPNPIGFFGKLTVFREAKSCLGKLRVIKADSSHEKADLLDNKIDPSD